MKYLQIERKCGAVIEVTRCIPKENRKTIPKERRRKKTPEDIKKANDQQAKEKIIRKINTNFQPGDIFAVLTYDQKETVAGAGKEGTAEIPCQIAKVLPEGRSRIEVCMCDRV